MFLFAINYLYLPEHVQKLWPKHAGITNKNIVEKTGNKFCTSK